MSIFMDGTKKAQRTKRQSLFLGTISWLTVIYQCTAFYYISTNCMRWTKKWMATACTWQSVSQSVIHQKLYFHHDSLTISLSHLNCTGLHPFTCNRVANKRCAASLSNGEKKNASVRFQFLKELFRTAQFE